MDAEHAEHGGRLDAQASHYIADADLEAWFAEHGLDLDYVETARIRLDYIPSGTWAGKRGGYVAAFLDATWFKRDHKGQHVIDGDQPAIGCSSVPLRSLPPLTSPDQ